MTATTLREPKTDRPDRPAVEADLIHELTTGTAARSIEGAIPALVVEGVTKRFIVGRKKRPVTAIGNVSLRLERGGTIGILGANGSGKSTLIRLVSGLLTLDEGRVEVFGHDIARDEMAVKRLINRVSVDAAFFKKLSPMENLLFAARLYGIDAGLARRETVAICERLGIARKRLSRPVEQMSRGMQQKVAIARALLTAPALLLLDEPTTGLDPRSKLDVQAFIEDIRASHDASIVLTTHDLDEADRLCEWIAVLNDGKAVVQDTPTGLKALVAGQGKAPTLHEVFMTYTGRSLDEDVEEAGESDDNDD
jgi:ABC-2 type transport system ATP-binding protein